ncbi:MAG TPA: hypothetical protein VGL94_06525 [Ktedonobacteraceae bacterium]
MTRPGPDEGLNTAGYLKLSKGLRIRSDEYLTIHTEPESTQGVTAFCDLHPLSWSIRTEGTVQQLLCDGKDEVDTAEPCIAGSDPL